MLPAKHKKYVDVIVRHSADGVITPRAVEWEDVNSRETYEIDKVVFSRPASSIDVGGFGILYEIMIRGKITKLFYSELDNRWFVEALGPAPRDE